MSDYLPRPDADVLAWAVNFETYAEAHQAALGLTAEELQSVADAVTTYDTQYNGHVSARAAAEAARQSKDLARETLESVVRPLVKKIQASPSVNNGERAALAISVPPARRSPVPAPESRPTGDVLTTQRLRHTLTFRDEATPTTRRKPYGVTGCEIWRTIAPTPPTDPSQLAYLGTATRSRYTVDFAGSDAGQTAHYMRRWVNTRGEKGPWSETISATVNG